MHDRLPLRRLLAVLAFACLVTGGTAPLAAQSLRWTQTGEPKGGNVQTITVDTDGALLAGGGNGVYRTYDGGATWEYLGFIGYDVRQLVVDDDGNLYAAIVANDVSLGGVFLWDEDHGEWLSLLREGDHPDALYRVQSLTVNGFGRLVAGTFEGAFMLTGPFWTPVNDGLTDLDIRVLTTADDGTVYAGTYRDGVFRSSNGGRTWSNLVDPTDPDALFPKIIRSAVLDGGNLLVAGWGDPHAVGGIFEIGQQDVNFRRVGSHLANPWSLTRSAKGELFAGTLGNGLFHLDQATDTWQAVGLLNKAISVLFTDAGGTMWAGTRGGLLRSIDEGRTWTPAGVPGSTVYDLERDASGSILAGTLYNGIFRTDDGGRSWTTLGLDDKAIYDLLILPDGTIIAGGYFGTMVRSRDAGATWENINHDRMGHSITSHNVLAFAGLNDSTVLAGTDSDGLFLSRDGGDTWFTGHLSGVVNTVAALPAQGVEPARYLAGRNNGLYWSDDDGLTWRASNEGLPNTLMLALHPSRDGRLWAGTDGGAAYSDDRGETWHPAGLDGAGVVAFEEAENGTLYAATFGDGVFRYDAETQTWTALNDGLSNPFIWDVAITDEGRLLAATYGSSTFLTDRPDPVITAVASRTPVPESFALGANYPNPFNPETVIPFTLDHADHVSLRIYDTLGREVETLVADRMQPGSYEVTWNASNLPSGVYYCRLASGEQTQTRHLTLVK